MSINFKDGRKERPNEFMQGFLQGIRETPRGYLAPGLILWRTLSRGWQWWFAQTRAISEGRRR